MDATRVHPIMCRPLLTQHEKRHGKKAMHEINFVREKAKTALEQWEPTIHILVDLIFGPDSSIGHLAGKKLAISSEDFFEGSWDVQPSSCIQSVQGRTFKEKIIRKYQWTCR
jgi:hypothetical protein